MKNLMIIFLAIFLATSAFTLPYKAYADGDIDASAQGTASLEARLIAAQKELIVLLNKKVELLRAELVLRLEQRLINAQLQLVGLLQQKITLLRAELNNR